MTLLHLVAGLATLTTSAFAQGTAVVSGVIRDDVGAPVREVLVVVDPDSLSLRTRSAADGSYRITVPNGRFEVRFVRIGYKPQSHTITVAGSPVELPVSLIGVAIPLSTVTVRVSRPGLYGTVVSRGIELMPHAPAPVRNANVQVLNAPYHVKSDAEGKFSIPDLPIGSHSILVALDHYISRMIPITVPPEGGIELTVHLDSLYAEYQRKEEANSRLIAYRQRISTSPATFVSAHELDTAAKDLRLALRYAPSVLTRGINLMDPRLHSDPNARPIIYIDGVRTYMTLPELKSEEFANFAGIEIYPPNTLQDELSVPGSSMNAGTLEDEKLFSSGLRAPGFSNRTSVRTRGNGRYLIMIWTTKRR